MSNGHDDGVRTPRPDLRQTPLPLLKDRRMDEAVEEFPFLPIGEDRFAQLAAIDRKVLMEDLFTEMVDDLTPDSPFRLLDGMGQLIEVDQNGPFLRQHPGDG